MPTYQLKNHTSHLLSLTLPSGVATVTSKRHTGRITDQLVLEPTELASVDLTETDADALRSAAGHGTSYSLEAADAAVTSK